MSKESPGKWRLELVYGLLLLAMGGLGYRLYHLVTVVRPEAEKRVQRQELLTAPDPGRPGGIYVRAGKALVPVAESRQVPSVFVDPGLMDDANLAPTAIALAQVLQMDPVRVQEKLFLRRDTRFAWIGRQVTPEEANAVRDLRLKWVGVDYEWRREYPCGALAGTVVGYPPVGDPNVPSGAGIERRMSREMAPRDGRRVLVTDVSRRPISLVAERTQPPQDGLNVVLCLDASIQAFLEKAVAEAVAKNQAKWGAGVVLQPYTGEVLAMCSVPGLNPNDFRNADPNQRSNRAIEFPYEPGSVAKPIFAAAAVERRVATYDTLINCEGGTYTAPRGGTISDHGNHYGMLSLRDVIVHSSNIGMAKVGEKLGNAQIYEIARQFGLGQPTGVDLPGDNRGILRPLRAWDGYSTRRVPFGQEISCTTLQLGMAFCALVNGGELLRPRVVDRILDPERNVVKEYPRTVVRRVLSRSVSDQTLSVLTDVVERGTGSECRKSPWSMFGKTGTAQIAKRGVYVDRAFVASFVGGAPARSPRALCLVSVYWPNYSINHFGAKVAAPAVREVLEQTMAYLGVPPDKAAAVARSESE